MKIFKLQWDKLYARKSITISLNLFFTFFIAWTVATLIEGKMYGITSTFTEPAYYGGILVIFLTTLFLIYLFNLNFQSLFKRDIKSLLLKNPLKFSLSSILYSFFLLLIFNIIARIFFPDVISGGHPPLPFELTYLYLIPLFPMIFIFGIIISYIFYVVGKINNKI